MKILPCQHFTPLGECLIGSLADCTNKRRHRFVPRRCCAECPAIGNCGQRKCEDAVKMVKAGYGPGVVK